VPRREVGVYTSFENLPFGHSGVDATTERGEEQKKFSTIDHRVARWFLLKSKIPMWVNFGGP
jgi:hypothetical protein